MRADNLPTGTVLGQDFCIERKLAEGGMGTVYVATQRSTGQRRAVKVFSPEVAVDDDLRRRFVQEARIGARIASEHIATVITAGVEGALPWLAMELLDGETLTQRVTRAGPFDPATAREFFAQLGHALVEAHRAGVAHRDLKPDNIFIARSQRAGAQYTVKVLDFGIAKVSDAMSRTTTSMSFGTPLWMAPEQMFPGAAGFPSDVWALGLVAFYVLTGRVYWRAGNAVALDTGALARERLSPRLEPASSRARELLGHDPLPRGFDAWFARCVVTDPQARHGSMVEALAGLDAMLGVTLGAQPLPPTVPTRTPASPMGYAATEVMRGGVPTAKPARRGVGRVVALGALGLVGVFGTGWWWSGRGGAVVQTTITAPREAPVVPPTESCPQGMARIAGGRVRLSADAPAQQVEPFCLDVTEVTVDAYARCVVAGQCPANIRRQGAGGTENVCNGSLPGRGDHPINCVLRSEAQRYCAARDARLPRESEWQLAAAGAEGRNYPWGDAPPSPGRLNACGSECVERTGTAGSYQARDEWMTTSPVGYYAAGASPEGVFDLAGNVREWVLADGFDPFAQAILRGGGFLDPPRSNAFREAVVPTNSGRTVGFRCAR